MIDSHAHLYDSAFDADRDEVLERAAAAGVTHIVLIGCDVKTSRAAVALAERDPRLYATVGVHPHEAAGADENALGELEDLSRRPRVVGWGEIGLDYHYMHAPREIQQDAFRRQIRRARSRGLPVVIHMRDAAEDTLRILKEEEADRIGGVFHCFTGDRPTAEAAMAMGFMISLSGIVTFRNAASLRELAGHIPLDRLMIETDCPYLAPIPHRGLRNEPAYVSYVARAIADRRPSDTLEDIVLHTDRNARRLFRMA